MGKPQTFTIDVNKTLAAITPQHPLFNTLLRHWEKEHNRVELSKDQWSKLAISETAADARAA